MKSFFLNTQKNLLSVHLNYCDSTLLCFSNADQNISRNMFRQFYDPVGLHVCILLLSVISFHFL